jgi:hypothetical protein
MRHDATNHGAPRYPKLQFYTPLYLDPYTFLQRKTYFMMPQNGGNYCISLSSSLTILIESRPNTVTVERTGQQK